MLGLCSGLGLLLDLWKQISRLTQYGLIVLLCSPHTSLHTFLEFSLQVEKEK